MKKIMALTLIVVYYATLILGCGPREIDGPPIDVTAGPVEPDVTTEPTVNPDVTLGDTSKYTNENMDLGYNNFAFNLLKMSLAEEEKANVMVSPASVYYAMAMAAMGAEGDTYAQIADLFGTELTKEDINAYLTGLTTRLTGDELKLANSIWISKNNLTSLNIQMSNAYMNTLKENYGAEATELVFDKKAVKEVNKWVKKHTDNMIPEVIDNLEDDDFLLLINAIAFDAKWASKYTKDNVFEDDTFTNYLGQKESAKMMYSEEKVYLSDENTTGFVKYYENNKYAFVALLPRDEEISLEEYLNNMSGEDFTGLLSNATRKTTVHTYLPAFSYDYEILMNDTLKALNVTDAFSPTRADFRGMIEEYPDDLLLYISKVIHKTHIEVDEQGTKAAAVTVIEMKCETTAFMPEESYYVRLDRPFVFAIIEADSGIPVFLGTVNSVE